MKYNLKNKQLILKGIKDLSDNEVAKIIIEKRIVKPWHWGRTEQWKKVKNLEYKLGLTETHIKNLEKLPWEE
jgi:hypothetical protein